jgi:hypothetical protein
MKKYPLKFWLIFIPVFTIIFFGWYFISFKKLLASHNYGIGIGSDVKNELNQIGKNGADLVNNLKNKLNDQTNKQIIEKLKETIIYEKRRTIKK